MIRIYRAEHRRNGEIVGREELFPGGQPTGLPSQDMPCVTNYDAYVIGARWADIGRSVLEGVWHISLTDNRHERFQIRMPDPQDQSLTPRTLLPLAQALLECSPDRDIVALYDPNDAAR